MKSKKAVLLQFLSFFVACTCGSFEPLTDEFQQMFRGKHLVFIGDALMKYQYLSLVYLLRHHQPASRRMVPNLVYGASWGNIHQFHLGSEALLNPFEHCDCQSPQVHSVGNSFENRYYRDTKRNIFVSYIEHTGISSRGRWLPGENYSKAPQRDTLSVPVWNLTLSLTLKNIVLKLRPKPTGLIITKGYSHNQLGDVRYVKKIVQEFQPDFEVIIWRTHSYAQTKREEWYQWMGKVDKLVCAVDGVACLNVSWTRSLGPNEYLDSTHYRADIYHKMNLLLTDILMKAGYKKTSDGSRKHAIRAVSTQLI